MRVRYNDLTDLQKLTICNGCGPKGGVIKVPDFLFKASCNHHDFNYWLGCNRKQRKKADLQFYREMIKDANSSDRPEHYKRWAQTYYRSVRFFGWMFFHRSKNQRTWEDVDRMMEE